MQQVETDNFEHRPIYRVKKGDILYEDIRKDGRVLMRSGQMLNERMITILKKRQIQSICVEVKNDAVVLLNDMTWNGIELKPIRDGFFQRVFTNSKESRYGNVLKTEIERTFIKNLFMEFMQRKKLREHYALLEDYDPYSFSHAIDVFTLATLFARSEGLQNLNRFAIGYLFYDIGKLDTNIQLLQKRDKLTDIEFEIIQRHTFHGKKYFQEMDIGHLSEFAEHHHEHYDGSGYPYGLKGDALPKSIQILHLVDVYSAMTMERTYRRAITAAEAFRKMYAMADEFNEALLHRFIEFIGIYPENADVFLSNGEKALIQSVSPFEPLNPMLKLASGKFVSLQETGATITKMSHYAVEVPKELYATLSDQVVRGEVQAAMESYTNLLRHYGSEDWCTQIIIPLYQMINVLKKINCMTPKAYEVATEIIREMTNDVWDRLLADPHSKPITAIFMQRHDDFNMIGKLFECLLYSNKMHAVIVESPEQLQSYHLFEHIICVGDYDATLKKYEDVNYAMSEEQLAILIERLAGKHVYEYTLSDLLQPFSV